MNTDDNTGHVVQFFDTHPINEQQILNNLERDGIALEDLTEDILQNYDQDHFGGLEANDKLAEKAGISESTHVLDVCSGIGGPARYLANTRGCKVTGIDITETRHDSAIRLTKLTKLDQKVDFVHGNALDMPFKDTTFDVVISQEAFAHIPDQPRLIGECVRVLKPGGTIAFSAIVASETFEASALARLQNEMAAAEIESSAGYSDLLKNAGCIDVSYDDLSPWWTEILVDRLAMYRSLKDTTVAKFGKDHYEKWNSSYEFFVGLFTSGQLGGGRFFARRSS
jgi:sarcosine/dimethylglycine N-methyltransferase